MSSFFNAFFLKLLIVALLATIGSTTENTSAQQQRLTFNTKCGENARVINDGRTALRHDSFKGAIVLTARPLKTNELFEVRLEEYESRYSDGLLIGVANFSAEQFNFPETLQENSTGTWLFHRNFVSKDGEIISLPSIENIDNLEKNDRVGVKRNNDGTLQFYVNGIEQGVTATNVPEGVYGIVDLYGHAVQVSIV